MTTPDKEEMPTEDRTAGDFWAEKRDGRWQLQMRHRGPGSSFCVAQINHWADNPEALTTRIADACNAYEPMREALAEMIYEVTHLSPENPDGGHSCVISGLTLTKARDALSGFAAPTKSTAITDGLIEALKFYAGETIHGMAGDNGYRARAALSTLPVNDRHHSGSDSYQADAGAPALSEKVNDRSEWLPIESAPHGPNLILAFRNDAGKWRRVIGWHAKQFEIEVDADELHSGLEEGPAGEAIYAKSGWYEYLDADEAPCNRIWPTHWQPLPSPPDAELNFSNDAERDGVSLKPDTSSQPASEAGKLSTDEVK